eukprot:SAG11_NODE_647_length_7957_cov_2.900903_7_plen_216_part_00
MRCSPDDDTDVDEILERLRKSVHLKAAFAEYNLTKTKPRPSLHPLTNKLSNETQPTASLNACRSSVDSTRVRRRGTDLDAANQALSQHDGPGALQGANQVHDGPGALQGANEVHDGPGALQGANQVIGTNDKHAADGGKRGGGRGALQGANQVIGTNDKHAADGGKRGGGRGALHGANQVIGTNDKHAADGGKRGGGRGARHQREAGTSADAGGP